MSGDNKAQFWLTLGSSEPKPKDGELIGKQLVKRKRTTSSNHEFKRHPNPVMDLAINHPD
jgi:hypothetical protein